MQRDGSVNDAGSAPPHVLIVEDHELLAQSLTFTLRADGMAADRAAMGSPASVVAAAAAGGYDVVLLDLDLGEVMGSGLDLIEPLQRTGARVVMLTGSADPAHFAQCVEAGAIGLVHKSASFEHLLAAIREAVALGTLLSPGQRDELVAELRRQRQARAERLRAFEALTPREQQVLAALMDGRTAEQIAKDWVVSITTVRSQIRSVLAKLDVHSQVAAVGLARRVGWEPLTEA